ncbi:MAG: S-layer homology domain-containing protein [Clostridiales bacterium]
MKKKYRLVLLFIIAFSLVLSFSMIASANTDFKDLNTNSKYYESVQKLCNNGCINGYPDGTFRENDSITRAELVKIVNIFFGYNNAVGSNPFWDIGTGDWYYNQVIAAVRQGYIKGYEDRSFRADSKITREEVCAVVDRNVILLNAPLNVVLLDMVSPWAEAYVSRVAANNLWSVESGHYFRATHNATRGEVCLMLAKITNNPAMNRTIATLSEYALPRCNNEGQKAVLNDIITSMQKYIVNPYYDYKTAADNTKVKYNQLSVEDRKSLKELIIIWANVDDLKALESLFFPEMDL